MLVSMLPPVPRIAGLLASLTVAAGLLIGAAGGNAHPSDPQADFLMEASATSATFTPVAGAPGEYTLVLRGVPSTVGVFELTRAGDTASLPTKFFMAYWIGYGDRTGQFTANPPRAVLRAADGSGGGEEVVVRLRDGSQQGRTLRFDAQVITSPAEWDQLEAKVDRVDETTPPGQPAPELEPTEMTNVEMFVDMPRTITQPKATPAPAAPGTTTTPSARRAENQTQRWMPNGGTCRGVNSSRLRNCWENIPNFSTYFRHAPTQLVCRNGFRNFVDGRGFAYNSVGEVDLGRYFFQSGNWGLGRAGNVARIDWPRCFYYYSTGWYGIGPRAVTFYTTSRCTWFMAKWSTNGRCW